MALYHSRLLESFLLVDSMRGPANKERMRTVHYTREDDEVCYRSRGLLVRGCEVFKTEIR